MAKKRPSAFDALGDIAPPKREEDITREVQHQRYGKPAGTGQDFRLGNLCPTIFCP
jgi:hypothetical protein